LRGYIVRNLFAIPPFQGFGSWADLIQGRRSFVACPWLLYRAPLALKTGGIEFEMRPLPKLVSEVFSSADYVDLKVAGHYLASSSTYPSPRVAPRV